MYNNVLENTENIAVWPVISFIIFFLFFLGLLLWVFFVDKKFIRYMADLPLAKTSSGGPVQEGVSSENKSSSQNESI